MFNINKNINICKIIFISNEYVIILRVVKRKEKFVKMWFANVTFFITEIVKHL